MLRVLRFAFLVCLFAATASAQFGHPLKGQWSGEWGPDARNQTRVLVDISWDGKTLAGSIDPGPKGIKLTKATLDGATWMVHLEADSPKIVIDGKMENVGAYARFITGTWTQDGKKGNFKLTRN